MTKRYTKETFLIRVKELYGDLYDFSEMNYVNQSTKIKVICSKHGEFHRAPTDLVRNRRCYECAKESSLIALNNKLNYLVFWDNNLSDAKDWFSNNCSLNFCEK